MAKISRFKRRNSDRSGFKEWEISLVKEGPFKVSGDEFDAPPPSKISLGGEGDIAGDPRLTTGFTIAGLDTPAGFDNPTVFITATGGITFSSVHSPMRVTGSNIAVDITADPQISRSVEGQVISLICVDSGITLDHGTGLNMMGSSRFVMSSGDTISFIYTSGGNVWNETSRGRF